MEKDSGNIENENKVKDIKNFQSQATSVFFGAIAIISLGLFLLAGFANEVNAPRVSDLLLYLIPALWVISPLIWQALNYLLRIIKGKANN